MNNSPSINPLATLNAQREAQGHAGGLRAFDAALTLLLVLASVWGYMRFQGHMEVYEKGILVGAVAGLIWLGRFWRALGVLMLVVGLGTALAIWLYQVPQALDQLLTPGMTEVVNEGMTEGASLARADVVFGLKYFLSSQSAILWMSVLFFMSTIFYWLGLLMPSQARTAQGLASGMAWTAVTLALIGTMVRWYESYLLGADIGHIPVSNLYEVFVLFSWLTTLFYLYYERHYGTRALGAFVMLVVSAGVGFLLWYTFSREAHQIQPLVPALQSWWMKVHVPANFIGYGTFALSAMVALAYLIQQRLEKSTHRWAQAFSARLPQLVLLDDVMYKAIAVGFAFFTIATILGAFWAAEAWGGYWSWDPKETWALIVWLNYAAWLHMRLMKGLRGSVAAWWALVGLLVTTFAFLGVNMFLSGLHSYGAL
jgi:cytochrome c-type biogenesis protein CcsB